eukprot:COSAG05_NODE_803_length_7215_cov_20.387858_1_plen_879_part_10
MKTRRPHFSHGQHFVLSGSGRGLFPVGENVAMPPRPNGTYGMEHYLTKLLQHHANAFRVWLGPSMVDNTIGFPECPGTFSGPSFCTSPLIIETKPRQYSLENAWRVDWVMRYAQEHRMYAHVVLDSWPQEMRGGEWNFSVFNIANGGPLELPFAMFDSLTSNVTDMWLQRMAYIGARFGAFRSVLGWELINEPDTPYMYASKAMKQQYPELQEFPMKTFLPWIQQLARALMAADQGQHLLTTNFASGKNMEQLTMLPEMTFLASHDYQYQGGTTHALHCGGVHEVQNRLRHAGLASKPVFVSENGMVPATLEAKDDPNGRGMKGSQWCSVAAGTAAADFSWWWDSALIDSPNHTEYYRHYDGISRFVQQMDFLSYNWTTHECNCKAAPIGCVATCSTGIPLRTPLNDSNATGVTLIWARNANFTYLPLSGPLATVTNASVEIICQYSLPPPLPAPGSTVQWFNTTTGEAVGASEPAIITPGPGPNPPYPIFKLSRPFLTDVAAVITGPTQRVRCEGGTHRPPPSPPPPSPSPPSPTPAPAPPAGHTVIRSGVPWYDTEGKRMYFGGANLYEENGLYYLVGEGEKVGGISGCFNFYRSPDLSTWTNLGCLLNISDIIVPPPFDNSTFRRGFGHGLRMERPKIFKCPTAAAGTAAYRLVFHCDTRNFNMRSIGVLVAEQVEGPYEQRVPCFKPDGEDSYDMGTFVDEAARGGDGNVYLIRSVQNQYAGISAFDRECMNTTGIVSHGPSIEGQALMRSGCGGGAVKTTAGEGGGGRRRETTRALFVAGSHLTGWNPNPAVFGSTTSQNLPGAKWSATDQYNPSGNPTTWNTQSSFIFPFSHADGSGTTFVWMADRWNEGGTEVLPGGLDNWTSVWLPLVPPQ